MTATARLLHQLRHDFRAARTVLGVTWTLLALSVPLLWLQMERRSQPFNQQDIYKTDMVPACAALFAVISLACLTGKISPHDPAGFYRSRPARSGVLLLSGTVLYCACILLPVLLQQALLCWMAVGTVPWGDVLLRLAAGTLPYAVCLAFAAMLGSSFRQKCVLIFSTFIFLYYCRIPDSHEATEGMFGVLPWSMRRYLDLPHMFLSSYWYWPEKVPQPHKVMVYYGVLITVALAAFGVAWRWRGRTVVGAGFAIAVMAGSMMTKDRLRHEPPLLSTEQEKALGLENISVQAGKAHLLTTGPPAGGFELSLVTTIQGLPPQANASVGPVGPVLKSGDQWSIRGTGYLFEYQGGRSQMVQRMREFSTFREALLGPGTTQLAMSIKDAADPAGYATRLLNELVPTNMAVFMHDQASSSSGGHPVTANRFEPLSAQMDLAVPVNECRVLCRLPLREGAQWHGNGTDIRVLKVRTRFNTIRTESGMGKQWTDCDVWLRYSALSFDHQDDLRWYDSRSDGVLIPILHHPGRRECLSDMEGFSKGSYFSGTPVCLNNTSHTFSLEKSRIGTVPENWLDGAELVIVESTYVGSVKRSLSLEGLKPTREKK